MLNKLRYQFGCEVEQRIIICPFGSWLVAIPAGSENVLLFFKRVYMAHKAKLAPQVCWNRFVQLKKIMAWILACYFELLCSGTSQLILDRFRQ
ncbi:hypothetical protein IPC695_01045 [Pseudomonas aeruginosa]|nr:hypothetical protein AXX03_05640 [Pseudomonas aeruginosa]RPY12151.1 hypothetical protein IPC695_01045 [Pseudomonas aeruginosa]